MDIIFDLLAVFKWLHIVYFPDLFREVHIIESLHERVFSFAKKRIFMSGTDGSALSARLQSS